MSLLGFQNSTSLLTSFSAPELIIGSVLLHGRVHHGGMVAPPASPCICFEISCNICVGWEVQCDTRYTEMCWALC